MTDLDPLADERGVPGVNAPRPRARWLRGLLYGALVLSIPVAGLVLYARSRGAVAPDPAATQKGLPASTVPARTFTLTAAPPPPTPPAPPAPPVSAPILPAPAAPVSPPAGPVSTPTGPTVSRAEAKPPRPKRTLNKSAGPVMVPNGSNSRVANAAAPGEKRDSDLGALLTATITPPRSAGVLPDRDYLLAKGTFIDCALETRLVSTVPGMTRCRVTRPIYSDTGRVVLVDRGSTVSGEYQATMRQGMARIFVLWTRIKTPTGVVVSLDSPATDALGAGGIAGYVDTHFWQRFGGALLLSLVDDAAGAAVAATQRDGQIVNFGGTSDATSSAVAEALRNTINIPPTLYTNQGARVGIYVARDLSFRAVYDLQPSGFSDAYPE